MNAVTTATPNNSLRQRMLQDMKMRGLDELTQKDYIRHVRRFAALPGQPPDSVTVEDLRRFQINQHERAVGPATINGAVSALRFLFDIRVIQVLLGHVNINATGIYTQVSSKPCGR